MILDRIRLRFLYVVISRLRGLFYERDADWGALMRYVWSNVGGSDEANVVNTFQKWVRAGAGYESLIASLGDGNVLLLLPVDIGESM